MGLIYKSDMQYSEIPLKMQKINNILQQNGNWQNGLSEEVIQSLIYEKELLKQQRSE